MTEQTAPTPKVTKLAPEEWKQLVLLNIAQLQNYLQGIPGNIESGAAGITEEHIKMVGSHLARGFDFMRAWAKATVEVPAQQSAPAQQQAQPKDETSQVNGAQPRKGGWPKGKKRTPKSPAVDGQQ